MYFIPTAVVSSEAQLSLSASLLELLQYSDVIRDQFYTHIKHMENCLYFTFLVCIPTHIAGEQRILEQTPTNSLRIYSGVNLFLHAFLDLLVSFQNIWTLPYFKGFIGYTHVVFFYYIAVMRLDYLLLDKGPCYRLMKRLLFPLWHACLCPVTWHNQRRPQANFPHSVTVPSWLLRLSQWRIMKQSWRVIVVKRLLLSHRSQWKMYGETCIWSLL
jgi:hypothetical protein